MKHPQVVLSDPVRAREVLRNAAHLGADTLVARALTTSAALAVPGRVTEQNFGSGDSWGRAYVQGNGLAVHYYNARPVRAWLIPWQELDQVVAQDPQGVAQLAVALRALHTHSRTLRPPTLPVGLRFGSADPGMGRAELRAAQIREHERWLEQVSRPWRARDDELRTQLRQVLDRALCSPQGAFDLDQLLTPPMGPLTVLPTPAGAVHPRSSAAALSTTGPQM